METGHFLNITPHRILALYVCSLDLFKPCLITSIWQEPKNGKIYVTPLKASSLRNYFNGLCIQLLNTTYAYRHDEDDRHSTGRNHTHTMLLVILFLF